ncbi:MAG: FtsQ-type POTRA domain-containing protein [Lachnospiraceae bacterium]|nr:FtsQ-type POTRA domain-containing protein [Lachnospiraceae bacterium]
MKRKRRVILGILVALALVAGLLGGVYYLITNYRIDPDKIIVEGNKHYSSKEITEMVMDGPLGDNSLILSWKYKNKKITDVPFVDSISVSVTGNDSIRITVFEKALAGYVKYLDRYIYFDKDGYVVESSSVKTEGIPQVTGIDFSSVEIGKKLGSGEGDYFSRTLDITKLMSKYDLNVDKIYFHDEGEITLYFGNVRVSLGNDQTHIEDKVMDLPFFLENLEGKSGVLNMEEYDEIGGMYVFKSDTN